jgi:hypothetical protein
VNNDDAKREWIDQQTHELSPDGRPLGSEVKKLLDLLADRMFSRTLPEWVFANGWHVMKVRAGRYAAHIRYLDQGAHIDNPAGYHWDVTQDGRPVNFGYGAATLEEAQHHAELAILGNP